LLQKELGHCGDGNITFRVDYNMISNQELPDCACK
jgi:hypothetical protein